MKNFQLSLCSVALAAFGAPAQGQEAHTHGEAQAAVVIDGSTVSLTLLSAMYNIVGFERAPQNDGEATALADAVATLGAPDSVIALDRAAACRSVSVTHNLSSGVEGETSGHDDDHEHEARHNEDHDHDDEHGHEDEQDAHRDLEADYVFECAAPDRLASLSFPLFAQFERLETLDVVVFKDDRQIADTLNRRRPTLLLD